MSIQSKASVCLRATLMAAALLIGARAAARPLELRSPDGRIAATVSVSTEGQPIYSLRFNGETVLAPSVLGLAFERHRQLSAGMEVSSSEQSSGVDSYRLMSGKTSAVRSRYNQLVVHLVERAGERRRLDVVLRARPEGRRAQIALRRHDPSAEVGGKRHRPAGTAAIRCELRAGWRHAGLRAWYLFAWWFHFDAYAPVMFDEAGAIAAAGGLVGCGAAVAGSVWRARQQRNVTT